MLWSGVKELQFQTLLQSEVLITEDQSTYQGAEADQFPRYSDDVDIVKQEDAGGEVYIAMAGVPSKDALGWRGYITWP